MRYEIGDKEIVTTPSGKLVYTGSRYITEILEARREIDEDLASINHEED